MIHKMEDIKPAGLSGLYIGQNHTTGGNSGSPAIDAYGNLVGLNFDRVWARHFWFLGGFQVRAQRHNPSDAKTGVVLPNLPALIPGLVHLINVFHHIPRARRATFGAEAAVEAKVFVLDHDAFCF